MTTGRNADNKLEIAMRQLSSRVFERFEKVARQDVTNSELLMVINDMPKYWNDDLRPFLTSISCEAVGGKCELAETAGLILSLGAAGMSIHDDIIDRSLNKRFKLTILGKHDVEKALLMGDLLIAKSWSTMHELIRISDQPLKIADLLELYGRVSLEVCEAEMLENSFRKKLNTSIAEYEKMLLKASAGLEACTRFGCSLGNGSAEETKALSEFARCIGVLLGLEDDIIDCLNIEGSLPHRMQFESVPLPLLYAAHSSKVASEKIDLIVCKSEIKGEDARDLLEICFETEAFEYTLKLINKYFNNACLTLTKLDPSNARDLLSMIIDNIMMDISNLCGEVA